MQYFSNLVHLWLVKPVLALRELNQQDPDFGFALLTSVNAIPELLGKLLTGTIDSKKLKKLSAQQEKAIKSEIGAADDSDLNLYNIGLTWALRDQVAYAKTGAVYKAIRNGLAHNAVIEGNVSETVAVAGLYNEYDLPVKVVTYKGCQDIVCISPDKFAQALVDSLHRYIYVLRFEIHTGSHDKILKFNEYLKAVKGK